MRMFRALVVHIPAKNAVGRYCSALVPLLNDNPCFFQAVEHLSIEQFIDDAPTLGVPSTNLCRGRFRYTQSMITPHRKSLLHVKSSRLACYVFEGASPDHGPGAPAVPGCRPNPMVSAVIPASPPSCIDSTAELGTMTIVAFFFRPS